MKRPNHNEICFIYFQIVMSSWFFEQQPPESLALKEGQVVSSSIGEHANSGLDSSNEAASLSQMVQGNFTAVSDMRKLNTLMPQST